MTAYSHNANDVTPILTSNASAGVIVTASSEYSAAFAAWKAFDHIGGTSSCWATTAGQTGWLKIYSGGIASWTVTSYTITSSTDSLVAMAKDWTLQGSNNNTDWTILDTRINQSSWVSDDMRTYTISSPQSFKYYKLDITANNGNLDAVEIGELELIGTSSVPEGYYDGASNTSTAYATLDATSNTVPSPQVCSMSHTPSVGSEAYKGFDQSVPGEAGCGYSITGPWSLMVDLGSGNEKLVNKYKLSGTSSMGSTWNPGAWVLQGSNDTGAVANDAKNAHGWTDLDTRSGQATANYTNYYTFLSDTVYRYYRLYVTSTVNGAFTSVGLGELKLVPQVIPTIHDVSDSSESTDAATGYVVISSDISESFTSHDGQPIITASDYTFLFSGDSGTSTQTYDSSVNNRILTINGLITYDTGIKKFGTSSLRFATIVGGTVIGDVYVVDSSDFTLDFWARFQNFNVSYSFVYGLGMLFYLNTDKTLHFAHNSTSEHSVTSSPLDISVDTFYHIAVVRLNGTVRIYLNGNEVVSRYIGDVSFSTTNFRIGDGFLSSYMYMDEIELLSKARWISNFTPPTAPYADYVMPQGVVGQLDADYAEVAEASTSTDDAYAYQDSQTGDIVESVTSSDSVEGAGGLSSDVSESSTNTDTVAVFETFTSTCAETSESTDEAAATIVGLYDNTGIFEVTTVMSTIDITGRNNILGAFALEGEACEILIVGRSGTAGAIAVKSEGCVVDFAGLQNIVGELALDGFVSTVDVEGRTGITGAFAGDGYPSAVDMSALVGAIGILDLGARALTFSGSGLVNVLGEVDLTAGKNTFSGAGLVNSLGVIDCDSGVCSVLLEGKASIVGAMAVASFANTIVSAGVVGSVGVLTGTFEFLQFTGISIVDAVLSAHSTSPDAYRTTLSAHNTVLSTSNTVLNAYCINLIAKGLVSSFTNYGFNSFAMVNGRLLGAKTSGCFELSGDSDAGTAIASTVEFPVAKFGLSNVKQLRAIKLLGRSDGNLLVTANDGKTGEWELTLDLAGDDSADAVIGYFPFTSRGRYLQLILENVNGSAFLLDQAELEMFVLGRV